MLEDHAQDCVAVVLEVLAAGRYSRQSTWECSLGRIVDVSL